MPQRRGVLLSIDCSHPETAWNIGDAEDKEIGDAEDEVISSLEAGLVCQAGSEVVSWLNPPSIQ